MTTRRTTRITRTTTRGYVAIHCEHIAAQTQSLRCVANKDMHIEGVNGGVVDLVAGDVFYLVRSSSLGADMFYIVLCDVIGVKKCSCPAAKPCKHEIHIAARLAARTAVLQEHEESKTELIDFDETNLITSTILEKHFPEILKPITRICETRGYQWQPQQLFQGEWIPFLDEKGKTIEFRDETVARRFKDASDTQRIAILSEYRTSLDEAPGHLNVGRAFSLLR